MNRTSPIFPSTAEVPRWLSAITDSPARETEWLDMLSQLEYIGCRKIFKGVCFDRVDVSVLQHAAEEAMHALLFKRIVQLRRGGDHSTWGECPLAAPGFRYFSGLDSSVATLVPDPELHYPLVSWVVEQRVLAVYPAYLALTKDRRVRTTLKQILAQEARHASQFAPTAEVVPQAMRAKALSIERKWWEGLEREIEAWLATPIPASYPSPLSLSTH